MTLERLDRLIPALLLGLFGILAARVTGFWWCLTYLSLSVAALVLLHVRWRRNGGFGEQTASTRCSGKWLAALRAACWCIAFFAVEIPFRRWGFETFSTFTPWTWLNIFLYFSLMLPKSIWDWHRGPTAKLHMPSSMLLWFEVLYGMAWLVDAMYWLVLVPYAAFKEGKDGWARRTSHLNIYLHSLNVVLMNVELANLGCSVSIYHSIFGVYFGVVYIAFNWIIYEFRGSWTYFFLDFNREDATLYLLLLQIVVVLSFGLGALLSKCMASIGRRGYEEAVDQSPTSKDVDGVRGSQLEMISVPQSALGA